MTAVQVTDVEALHRRSLRVPMAAQLLSGAGLAAGVTVGALLAEHMLGSTSLSGLPAGLLTLGSAGAALLIGQISQRSDGVRDWPLATWPARRAGTSGLTGQPVNAPVPRSVASGCQYCSSVSSPRATSDGHEPPLSGRAARA